MPSPFETHLVHLLRARFPILYITTWEEERFLEALKSLVENETLIKKTRKLYTWSLTEGLVSSEHSPVSNTTNPIAALNAIRKMQEPAVFVLRDFHIHFGYRNRPVNDEVVRKLRDLVPCTKESLPKNIILISPVLLLPDELQKDVTILDFPLPDATELMSNLKQFVQSNYGGSITFDMRGNTAEKLVKAALGLTLSEAENAFAHAAVERNRLDESDVRIIQEEKCQIIKKTGILEYIESDLNIQDVGGLDNLKSWLRKRDKSWLDDAKKYSLPAPKGILLTGVPGCGKSMTAKVISSLWQLPLLRMDIGKLFGGIVGSSEQNMRTAIRTAEAISPSLLWIDEIEKGFSGIGSSGDSGTATRVFGSFLTWIQEKEKPVFVIATANNIANLPPELLRKGRFDEIFFVDLPTLEERKEIFKVHLKKRLKSKEVIGELKVSGAFLGELASLTEGFIGAEIEQVVVSALFEAFAESRSLVRDDFLKAIRNTVPLSQTQAEQIFALRAWANTRAVAATSPQEYKTYQNTPEPGEAENVCASRGGRMIDL